MGDMLHCVMAQNSPVMRRQGYKQIGGEAGTNAVGAALSTLGRSGTDVRSPVAMIVVPTRELGVQIAMMLYQLVGGNVKKSATERSGKRNMFKVCFVVWYLILLLVNYWGGRLISPDLFTLSLTHSTYDND